MPRSSISAIVCAYNEAERIGAVLDALQGHPLIAEAIVVDDGSTDGTAGEVAAFPGVRLISYTPNRGKTCALVRGLGAASGDHVMLLDADLAGADEEAITALAQPVLDGEADVTLSLRSNSLGVYRWLGLDFVSGERVLPRRLLADAAGAMLTLPRWGGEVFINEQIIAQRLRVAVVDWRGVSHTPKRLKVGVWQGVRAELEMVGDAVRVLSPLGVIRQNVELLRLTR